MTKSEICTVFLAMIETKKYKLLEFADISRDVEDPWYTGDFETVYNDVFTGCEGFLRFLESRKLI